MRAGPLERLGANVERERDKFHDDLEALCIKANRWFSVEEMREILTAKAAQYANDPNVDWKTGRPTPNSASAHGD